MLPEKIISQEGINASVEHGIHVSALGTGAVILHQTIGLKRIGAYLTAECYGILSGIIGLSCSITLTLLQSIQTGLEHAHGAFSVALLGTLVLTLRHNTGGNVRDAHGRLGLV